NVLYKPHADDEYKAGDITVSAWVESQEAGADNREIAKSHSTSTGHREAVNNGFEFTVGQHDSDTERWVVSGNEVATAMAENAIDLDIEGSGLWDTDNSEHVVAAQLSGVPVGFLVYVDGKLASNAGASGNTSNWLIPVSADGNALPT